jgi:hypothetical protein
LSIELIAAITLAIFSKWLPNEQDLITMQPLVLVSQSLEKMSAAPLIAFALKDVEI